MSDSFRFVALPHERFEPLFQLDAAALVAVGARRVVVDEKPGYPCRVSLVDAEVGETVLLLPFTHHDVTSPYRASGPIFVRAGATTALPKPGAVPGMLRHRQLSIRAYDQSAMLVDADVVMGSDLEATIRRLFGNDAVSYLHVHNAKPGCYDCSVVRS